MSNVIRRDEIALNRGRPRHYEFIPFTEKEDQKWAESVERELDEVMRIRVEFLTGEVQAKTGESIIDRWLETLPNLERECVESYLVETGDWGS